MHIAIQSTTPKHYIFKKSPLMEKNLLLQVILHRVKFILVLRNIKIAQNPNNSYPLNKPYLRLKTVKTISHTYLISKKRRTIFSKNIKPYVWLIRKWRVILLSPVLPSGWSVLNVVLLVYLLVFCNYCGDS